MINRLAQKTRRLGACVLFAAIGLGAPAAAQNNWVNPDVNALREEVRRLDAQVRALSGGGGQGGGLQVSGDAILRLDALDTQLRSVIGRIEQVEFEIRRQADARDRAMQQIGFRLGAIEDHLGLTPPSPDLAASSGFADAAVGGAASQGQGDLGAGFADAGGSGDAAFAGTAVVDGAELNGGRVPIGAVGAAAAPVPSAASAGYEVDENGQLKLPPAADDGQGADGVLGTLPVAAASAAQTPAALSPVEQGPASSAEAYRAAVSLVRSGAFAEAEASLRGFIAQYPSDPQVGEAMYWLGETHYVRGQFVDASRVFLDAFKQHPQAPRAPDSLLKLGMTLARLNQVDEACLTFREVMTRFPGAPDNVRNRAQAEARRASCG